MQVVKRDSTLEGLDVNKVHKCITWACEDLENVSVADVETNAHVQFFDGITTEQIHSRMIQSAAELISVESPDYEYVAARLLLQQIVKECSQDLLFGEYIAKALQDGKVTPLLVEHYDYGKLNSSINNSRNLNFKYLGLQTLYDRYLIRDENRKVIESPQHFFMRVACGICLNEDKSIATEKAIELYELFSSFEYLHSTPTLFNSGSNRSQMSSCFVLTVDDSAIEYDTESKFGKGIMALMAECAVLSKYAGGIGTDFTRIRPVGSLIKGTSGISSGVVPYLRIYNSVAAGFNQCFSGDTRIFTNDGFKFIKDIEVGDRVLGIDGEFNKVGNTFKYENSNDMLAIDVKHSIDVLNVTPNHHIFALRGHKKISRTISDLKFSEITPEFTPASELKEGDFIAQVIPTETKNLLNFTEDDAYMYGIMLSDGCISKRKLECSVSLGYPKKEVHEFVINYLTARNVKFWISQGINCISIKWSRSGKSAERSLTTGQYVPNDDFTSLPFREHHLYNSDNKKHIHANLSQLPKGHVVQLIKGLIQTDGNISRGKEVTFCNTSLPLIEGMRQQLLRLGCPSAAHTRLTKDHCIRGIKIKDSLSYVVRVPMIESLATSLGVPTVTSRNWIEFEGHVFSRIKSISKIVGFDEVYDLQVNGHPSYSTSSGLVHNSGLRPGSFASYLEPWHGDIEAYIDIKKPTGDARLRAMDIFPYLWMNDLFLERVKSKSTWSLFDVSKYPELHDLYGDEFKARYEELESQGLYIKQVDAMELWVKSVTSLAETGAPMIAFKDEANRRNPQRHVGTIKSSNLCVAHDTQVLTDEGYHTISAMVGEFVNVWNGEEFSNVEIVKTGENQKLLKVTTTTGNSLECTEYHKFYVIEGLNIIEKRAIDLKQGDSLLPFNSPNDTIMGYAVSHIESVIDEGLIGDTYCFNEPKRHMGVFNGLLTGNCSEIFEVTSDEETAVCNLSSINLARLEFDDIKRVVPIAIRALDNVIDLNFYPSDKAKVSNMKHRPIGLGVMGWAEYLIKHNIDFESQQHLDECNRVWSEISYWAIHTSCELAKEKDVYQSFEGSDWSRGILPYMTAKQESLSDEDYLYWNSLAEDVKQHGVRNSLMLALAPTASISAILGTTPSIEVAYKLSYLKDNLSGKFMVIDPTLRYNNPAITKTAFEIDQKWAIKAAAVRQKYIDQGQSLNLYKAAGTRGSTISSWFMLAYELGLKSTYYLKNQDESVKVDAMIGVEEEVKFCSISDEGCESCQ